MSRSKVVATSHRSGYAGRDGPLQDSRDAARWDELDTILNGADESGREDNAAADKPQRSTWQGPEADKAQGTDALGIDSEVKVRKPRAPAVKLDEERLLSGKGIPKLRKITKERLRFKGKGHEFSDVTRLLNLYQLWLDDLFPKANFADGLAMIEKLGHKKRLQVMRREWIDESKDINRMGEDEIEERDAARIEAVVESNAQQEAATQVAAQQQQEATSREAETDDNMHQQPDEDELDMLLAQEIGQPPSTRPLQTADFHEQAVDNLDDMDALEAMGDDW